MPFSYGVKVMANKLIFTIECEKKSGGEETAEILSKRLRIKIYDKKALSCSSDSELAEKIKSISEKESCVFLSCNANNVLIQNKNVIKIFITSSKVAHKKDDSDFTNATAYDLCINTALIGTEGAVQVVLEYLTAKSF